MCSADLHDVLDCHGNVIQQCDQDLGCSSGTCVDPCMAAADNTRPSAATTTRSIPTVIFDDATARASRRTSRTRGTRRSRSPSSCDGQPLPIDGFARMPVGPGPEHHVRAAPERQLPPGQVAILFLAHSPGPSSAHGRARPGITPAYTTADAAAHGTGIGNAFHITTSAPVVAYDIFPYGGGTSAATSATLLLPTTAWDTNYVAVDAFRKSDRSSGRAAVHRHRRPGKTTTHVTIQPDGRDRRRHGRRRRGAGRDRDVHRSTAARCCSSRRTRSSTGSAITVGPARSASGAARAA